MKKEIEKISKEKCTHKRWSYASKNSGGEGVAICSDCNLWMTHSSALQYQNLRYQKTTQKWFNIITMIISLTSVLAVFLVAHFSLQWQRQEEANNEVVSLYRNIIANEEIFIANDYRDFLKKPIVTNFPEHYINYPISGRTHEILQRKFGIINYRYLLYYLNQISLLDDIQKKMATEVITSGPDSVSSKRLIKSYSELSIQLGGEDQKWDTKSNLINDTGCLLYIFQKSFDFLTIDERDKTVSCSNESLNRVFGMYGYLGGNAPKWFEEELRKAVKEVRGIDITNWSN